jgi:hypothetical protein
MVPAGGTLTTDSEGDGATPEDLIETAVLTPQGGQVIIDEGPARRRFPRPSRSCRCRLMIAAPAGTPHPPLLWPS